MLAFHDVYNVFTIVGKMDFSSSDINTHFSKTPFLNDIRLAWNSLTDKTVIYNYGNEILWNNSNIRVGDKTVLFKNWQQSGIKYLKDIFDHDRQNSYTFAAMKEKYNLPSTDFLIYLSILEPVSRSCL